MFKKYMHRLQKLDLANTTHKKYLVTYAEWKKYNRHFWVREYYCETIGDVNEETIKRYIREQ